MGKLGGSREYRIEGVEKSWVGLRKFGREREGWERERWVDYRDSGEFGFFFEGSEELKEGFK